MAEFDGVRKPVTGRQQAHLEITLRAGNYRKEERSERRAPELSAVEWEVREEVCQPYRITALVSTTEPVSRRDILGQWAKFRFQTEEGAPVREFRGFVTRFDSVLPTALSKRSEVLLIASSERSKGVFLSSAWPL